MYEIINYIYRLANIVLSCKNKINMISILLIILYLNFDESANTNVNL